MPTVTAQSEVLRAAVAERHEALSEILARYGARNPRLFGSVARGDARVGSDVDILVDLQPGAGNELLRVAGLSEEFSRVLGIHVDVVSESLLREPVSQGALRDAVAF